MPFASGCASTCARTASMLRRPPSGRGRAMVQVLLEMLDRNADVRLLVIDAVETEALEHLGHLRGIARADHDVAADVQKHAAQSDVVEAPPEVGAPVLA